MGSECDQNVIFFEEKGNLVEYVQVEDLRTLTLISAWNQLSSNQEKLKHS